MTAGLRNICSVLSIASAIAAMATPAFAQDGSVLTNLENDVVNAAHGWESTVTSAAQSLFWILAGIEVGIAAVWLALSAASLDTWFAELVRRIMFIGVLPSAKELAFLRGRFNDAGWDALSTIAAARPSRRTPARSRRG